MLEQEATMPLHELLAKMKEVGNSEIYCVQYCVFNQSVSQSIDRSINVVGSRPCS